MSKPFESYIWRDVWVIDRTSPSGMYTGWNSENGTRLRADTLGGLKQFIRDVETGKVEV